MKRIAIALAITLLPSMVSAYNPDPGNACLHNGDYDTCASAERYYTAAAHRAKDRGDSDEFCENMLQAVQANAVQVMAINNYDGLQTDITSLGLIIEKCPNQAEHARGIRKVLRDASN